MAIMIKSTIIPTRLSTAGGWGGGWGGGRDNEVCNCTCGHGYVEGMGL